MFHGFTLIKEQRIAEINSLAQYFKHVKSGAEFINVMNDDENKVFGIAFKTLPGDSTGVAHILEHSVLCGSRKYPVKEPFIELAKGSLNTYLNASTYPDKTVYPVASTNTQDLYNLADVYLDCVLYPQLSEWTLKQEGWHYELENATQPLIYKGVVFNEMKGAYSSADSVFYRETQRALLPDTVYGVDSGGDPAAIPDLGYVQFKQFWSANYHPANAKIWWYGNDDPAQRLAYLDHWLKDFDTKPRARTVDLQKPWLRPQAITKPYDAGEGDTTKKTMTAVAWLMAEPHNEQTKLALEILGHMLTGTPAAPLRKALIDSGLGEDLAPGTGYRSGIRQDGFAAGLKGIRAEDAEKVHAIVLDTLRHHAINGFASDLISASLNTIEFRYRESNFGGFPRGIAYFLGALDTWLHDEDPFAPLQYDAEFAALKKRLHSGEPVFAELIKKYLIDNPHRVTITLMPDVQHKTRLEAAERKRLDAARASMSASEVQRIVGETQTLKQMQLTPDSAENLAKIPSLQLSDLERNSKSLPNALQIQGGSRALHHDLFTNGIVYLDVAFDGSGLGGDDIALLPVLSRALMETGTSKEDFVSLSRRVGRFTGGVRAAPSVYVKHGSAGRQAIQKFFISGKCTLDHLCEMLSIMRDVLTDARLDNSARIKQIVLENKSRIEAGLVSGGNGFVASRLRAGFTQADAIREQLGGISQLFFLRDLAARIDQDWPAVRDQLARVARALVSRDGLLMNITLDEQSFLQRASIELAEFAASLPLRQGLSQAANESSSSFAGVTNEGLTIPAQVNYVGKAANLYAGGYNFHGSAWVAQNLLRTVYLWERVRVQGGAYGGSGSLDDESGVFTFTSYRDPNVTQTLDIYDEASQWLREHHLTNDEVRRCIIGVIGDIDTYQLPDAKGSTALRRWLTGITDAERQQRREEVLGTTVADIRHFADALACVRDSGRVAVLGSTKAIEAANAERVGLLHVRPVM